MKNTLKFVFWLGCSLPSMLHSSDQSVEVSEMQIQYDMQDCMFDEPALALEEELPVDLQIAPTKRSFSFKEVPFYFSIFFSSLWNQRIKPAYYAIVGYLVGESK